MTEYEVRVDVALVMRVMAEDESDAETFATSNRLWREKLADKAQEERVKGVCWYPAKAQSVRVIG